MLSARQDTKLSGGDPELRGRSSDRVDCVETDGQISPAGWLAGWQTVGNAWADYIIAATCVTIQGKIYWAWAVLDHFSSIMKNQETGAAIANGFWWRCHVTAWMSCARPVLSCQSNNVSSVNKRAGWPKRCSRTILLRLAESLTAAGGGRVISAFSGRVGGLHHCLQQRIKLTRALQTDWHALKHRLGHNAFSRAFPVFSRRKLDHRTRLSSCDDGGPGSSRGIVGVS